MPLIHLLSPTIICYHCFLFQIYRPRCPDGKYHCFSSVSCTATFEDCLILERNAVLHPGYSVVSYWVLLSCIRIFDGLNSSCMASAYQLALLVTDPLPWERSYTRGQRSYTLLYCRTRFYSDSLTTHENSDEKWLLSLEFVLEMVPIIPYIGVVFPFIGSLSLDHNHFYFLMILKKTLTFLLLSNPVLQHSFSLKLVLGSGPSTILTVWLQEHYIWHRNDRDRDYPSVTQETTMPSSQPGPIPCHFIFYFIPSLHQVLLCLPRLLQFMCGLDML